MAEGKVLRLEGLLQDSPFTESIICRLKCAKADLYEQRVREDIFLAHKSASDWAEKFL